MRYPFTAFSGMFLIIVSVIVFGGFKQNKPPKIDNKEIEKSFISMINPSIITLYDNIIEIPEKSDIEQIQETERKPVELYPNWRKVNYGGKIYYVDDKGFYHGQDGRVWRPIYVDTTAYTWLDDGTNPRIGAGDGKTSTRRNAKTTYGIASGSPLVPSGSIIHVSGYGIFPVDDTGGKLRQEWRYRNRIRLDLRIPNRRYDGAWRSNHTIRRIALKHGIKENRMVLILVEGT